MSLYWIWVSYIELDRWHIILSVIFVALHLDKPNEWPPLFPSSPMQAYSLRRFWGIFWYRLETLSCVLTGHCVGRRTLRILPGSRIEKVFVAFWSFLLTWVFHAIVGCYSSSPAGWHPRKARESITFLLLNFTASVMEWIFVQCYHRSVKNRGNIKFGRIVQSTGVTRFIGLLWVFAFFPGR
jgi:hypothetical protein